MENLRCPTCGKLTKQEHSTRVKNALRKVVSSGKKLGRPRKPFDIKKVLHLLNMGYSYRKLAKRINSNGSTIHRKVEEYYLNLPISKSKYEIDFSNSSDNKTIDEWHE